MVRYAAQPLVSSYAFKGIVQKINNSAAIVFSKLGAGRVLFFAHDPVFRSYWPGTSRLLSNALLLGPLLNVPEGALAPAAAGEEAH